MRLVIGIPAPEMVNVSFAIDNLQGIISYTKQLPEIDEIFVNTQSGVRTDRNRNIILKRALENDADAILWLDADMLYPHNIVEKYTKHEFDVIGCLYFKRTKPFSPVAYIKNPNDTDRSLPVMSLDPRKLPEDTVIDIDGLGWGGMMVKRHVYESMGDDMWSYYDKNFHIPDAKTHNMTHDVIFCENAQKHGNTIKLHTGVHPAHITQYPVTREDWERCL